MKILNGEYPPNYKQINDVLNPPFNAVFTYGDSIYNPGGGRITKDIEMHERTHMRRQGEDTARWWQSYLISPHFRYFEEIAAYRVQYFYLKQTMRDRQELFEKTKQMAVDLSSALYGNIVGFQEAYRNIIVGRQP